MAFKSQLSIEDFKSALANGGVRPTMFSVEIDFPDMVTNVVSELKEKTKFLIKASQIPSSNIGVVPVPFRGRILKVSGDRTFEDWNVTIINDTDFRLRKGMEKWMELIQNHNFALGHEITDRGTGPNGGSGKGYFGTGTVRQLDRQGGQLRMYEFNGIWPTTMDNIELNFESSNTIEEYSVTFAVQYWHAAKDAEGGDLGGNQSGESDTGPSLGNKDIVIS